MKLEKTLCHCMKVTNGHVKKAVEEGAKTFEEVQEKINVSKGCKKCVDNVKRVVDEFIDEHHKK